jgi:hypothetical protein
VCSRYRDLIRPAITTAAKPTVLQLWIIDRLHDDVDRFRGAPPTLAGLTDSSVSDAVRIVDLLDASSTTRAAFLLQGVGQRPVFGACSGQ